MKNGLRLRQRGLSLVEVMVSLVIGLVVIGVVLSTYLGSGVGGRHSSAMAQITEDATVALNIMRAQIEMAGFSQPNGVNADSGEWTRLYGGDAVVGCDKGFKTPEAKTIEELKGQCSDTGNSDAIAIAYQADASSVVLSSDSTPADCLGQKLTEAGGYFLAYNRFYIDSADKGVTPALYCRGNGGDTPGDSGHQPLVENIVGLEFEYGIANPATKGRVVRYHAASGMKNEDWPNVVAVRACVVVQSADNVMDEPTAYYDCSGTKITPSTGDRKMYRAFHSTVVLHNRLRPTDK